MSVWVCCVGVGVWVGVYVNENAPNLTMTLCTFVAHNLTDEGTGRG